MKRLSVFSLFLVLFCIEVAAQPAVVENAEVVQEVPEAAVPANPPEDAPPVETPETEPTMDQLRILLTDASLSESREILDQMAELGGLEMLPLFESMLAGDLYYDEETLELLNIIEDSSGNDVGFTVLGEIREVDLSGIETSKIRVNNSLRGFLRTEIATIQLSEGNADERRISVRNLITQLDEDSLPLLETARANEENEGVAELLDVGIAMIRFEFEDDPAVRLEAVSVLHGRLEVPVRNLLNAWQRDEDEVAEQPEIALAVAEALASIEGKLGFYGFVEQMFFGLSLGSVLLLAAIGLAVTFGVMGVINMAHGEMLMLGAYTTYMVQVLMPNHISASLVVAIPAAFVVSGLVGIFIQRFVIRYLTGRPLETLLATFGISLVLQQTVRTIFSPLNRRVISPSWLSGSWEINPALSLTYNRLYILIFAIVVFIILQLILKKTSLGLNVRAVSQNRNMARAMGIRTDRVDALTFGLGSGIAGIAGVALSQLTNVGPNLGQSYIIDSFMVVVFGGVGNLLGTLVGAFSLGVAGKFLEPVTGAVLANIVILVFIILFIQKRPKGLFPQKGRAAE